MNLSFTASEPSIIRLPAVPITRQGFAPFGQVIRAQPDGKMYDAEDAALVLHNGVPRFYIMRLQSNGRQFHCITRHRQCTQCLGALGSQSWLLAVAAPTTGDVLPSAIHSFVIDGDCFVKLHVGTWHAGPYFDTPSSIDFYNLELADTNINDHHTVDLKTIYGVSFIID